MNVCGSMLKRNQIFRKNQTEYFAQFIGAKCQAELGLNNPSINLKVPR